MFRLLSVLLITLLVGVHQTSYAEVQGAQQCFSVKDKPQRKKAAQRTDSSTVIFQNDIPLTIVTSGTYELGSDILYVGSGKAIIVKADNVKLNLGAHSILLSNQSATGIFIDSVSEFVIESDRIDNTSAKTKGGYGILVSNAKKGLIKDVFATNHVNDLFIDGSDNIRVENSEFSNATGTGVMVLNSKNIVFSTCTFSENLYGMVFDGSCENCSVLNSSFPSATYSNLAARQVNGLIVEYCSFTNSAGNTSKPNLVQLGDSFKDQSCNDVIFKHCTIINKATNTAPEGLSIYHGKGFLVESCVIDTNNTNKDQSLDLSGIHISNQGTLASNVIIRNCVIQGSPTNGIYSGNGSTGVLIENCVATGALKDGIFLSGTTGCTIRNNLITNNSTNGIFLGQSSSANAVINNTVTTNGSSPIASSAAPIGNGIGISTNSSGNTIQYNQIFNNSLFGINDLGSNNRIYYNTAYANTTDYSAGITNVNKPGKTAKSGGNISD